MLLLQLLPIKQVISYFFIDNQLTVEITVAKSLLQPNEEKLMHEFDPLFAQFTVFNESAFILFSESLPSLYTAEIPTPPPNRA